uniref:Putative secreted protein n=1 Tax=Anopheles darlingi TaxID=43151 RepID=A0A2M4D0E3_ANODA
MFQCGLVVVVVVVGWSGSGGLYPPFVAISPVPPFSCTSAAAVGGDRTACSRANRSSSRIASGSPLLLTNPLPSASPL